MYETADDERNFTMTTDKESKYRYFAFLVYRTDTEGNVKIEEDELIRNLAASFGCFAVSPLHQPDDDDECEHWHVIYKHGNSVQFTPVYKWITSHPEFQVHNDFVLALYRPDVYQRYLLHLDNPEKEQFAGGVRAVTTVNGFPYDIHQELSVSQKLEMQQEIEHLAVDHCVYEYSKMTLMLSEEGLMEHYYYFTTHTHHFAKFLDSLRHSIDSQD